MVCLLYVSLFYGTRDTVKTGMAHIRPLSILICLTTVLLAVSVARAVEKRSPRSINPVVQNHFREQVILVHSREDRYGRRFFFGNLDAVDHQASLLTREFVSKVEDKMSRMQNYLDDVQAARMKAMYEPADTRARVQSLSRWSKSLDLVSRQAKDLHGMLSTVLGGVLPDDRYRPAVSSHGLGSGFEEEMRFVEDRLSRATRSIRDFMLGRDLTVSVEELRGGNMLALLQQVRAMARELSIRLASVSDRVVG